MTLTKGDKHVTTTFKNVIRMLKNEGWTEEAAAESVPIVERVEALEGAVTEIAAEVYGDG